MGWYKVPRSSFDYDPASIDTVLADRAVKELEERMVSTTTLVHFEKDTRTMSIIGSFSDMIRASVVKHINETLEDKTLSQQTRDGLTGLADLEVSRGYASFHALTLALSERQTPEEAGGVEHTKPATTLGPGSLLEPRVHVSSGTDSCHSSKWRRV